jgi:hypothetical protein
MHWRERERERERVSERERERERERDIRREERGPTLTLLAEEDPGNELCCRSLLRPEDRSACEG